MVFELIISGLCAFVLSPCGNNPTTVSAVFPGGPFKYPFEEAYPEHEATLTVETTFVDHESTWMPDDVVEAGGKQYAIYHLSGRLTLAIDGQPAKVQVKPDDEFHKKVINLKEAVPTKPQLEKLRNDLLKKRGNKYGRANISFPNDPSAPLLEPHAIGEYTFSPGAPAKWVSDSVSVKWQQLQQQAIIEFTNRKGATLRLKDLLMGGQMKAVMASFAPHIGAPTTSLMHFPSYFFLSDKFGDLKMTEIHVPTLASPSGPTGSAGAKPVACAICTGCGG